jgi:hypothetical protein
MYMTIITSSSKVVASNKFTTKITIDKKYSMKSLFTSNVFYKPHTNTQVSSTVTNSRIVSRRT